MPSEPFRTFLASELEMEASKDALIVKFWDIRMIIWLVATADIDGLLSISPFVGNTTTFSLQNITELF